MEAYAPDELTDKVKEDQEETSNNDLSYTLQIDGTQVGSGDTINFQTN